MDNLSGIVAFVQTAEASSFVAASQRLGVSPSAVGKSVARLEQHLGVRLLQRSTRRVSLTDDGERFYERCRQILDALNEAESMMLDANAVPRGRLRVSLPTIGYRFLLPILPAFAERYPEIDLELDFNDRIVDVIEGGFDAAIRSGNLADSQLMAKRLGPFRFVLCASPGYLQRRGVPLTPADLAEHACLRFRFPTSGKLQPWAFRGQPEEAAARFPTALTCNNMEALRAAAELGLGIGYMPDFLARDALRAGTLQGVLDDHLSDPGQFSVLWPSSRQLSPKLRAFVDFLSEHVFSDP
ncbi:LysR family transcriptional regulator [Paraburkholderia bryophila]|uniref:LysR family transcriptional regulator n=1 Tax=Paraburkholderia bryophila TaxID=420952 RepID=A0A329C3J3_9BURK|nr:LysR family transcriptional regulator [Paraburkholderia bryophila]RAS28830.1 LysR family transcriptional regulator [Paraburkholderia bryophila]